MNSGEARGGSRRLGGARPALRARGAKPASTARRREANGGPAAKLATVWTDLSRNAGRWMPPRWRGKSKSKHDAAAARRSDSLLTPPADGTLVLVNALSPIAPFRTRAEQEAEAASMGVDFATYMTLIDLQSRDITPEDYDALRNLDSQVKPRTLSRDLLEAHAPRWRVPRYWRVLRATDEKVAGVDAGKTEGEEEEEGEGE
eukprot:CAMPEP_0185472150 /NCGR_PEP_ID=MMETSP1366-20130426/668_1 /TAXON_ID=38817 /ORGANISM="Gephyrocapsa oceanica, Strain RCC1303" /LENGTH=201 /DNA_ID=CAMNT_0028078947 /DNA_START=45 /DNA_END=647 /DNA_ORIENTATION=+